VVDDAISAEVWTCNTGMIDSRTLSMMSLSRCGVPDTDTISLHRRPKRYVHAGMS